MSRYLGDEDADRQVRVSIWKHIGRDSVEAEAAISLDDAEAERLAHFLEASSTAESSRLSETS